MENNNSTKVKAKEIPTILYHFIYENGKENCNEIICHSTEQLQSHINYLKTNDFFSLTMQEFEDFITVKINLPKYYLMLTLVVGSFYINDQTIFI